jgi:hypothetical protein
VTGSWDPVLRITDGFVAMDRPLYLLVHDEQVQAADTEDKLYRALNRCWDCRTVAGAKAHNAQGKALLHEGALFAGVTEAALERFLQVVTAAELSGTHMLPNISRVRVVYLQCVI